MSNASKKTVLDSWSKVKKDIEVVAKKGEVTLKDVQGRLQKFAKEAEKDLKNLVGKDLKQVVSKLKSERKSLEKSLDKTIQAEIKRAKSFLNQQKGEFAKFQKKIEGYLPKAAKKAPAKKKTKKKVARKTTAKKAPASSVTNS
jgi:paraquat-inducible protein B